MSFSKNNEQSKLPREAIKPVEKFYREIYHVNFTGIVQGDCSGADVDTHDHVETNDRVSLILAKTLINLLPKLRHDNGMLLVI